MEMVKQPALFDVVLRFKHFQGEINGIGKLPEDQRTKVKSLDLSANNICSIGAQMQFLPSLSSLRLDGCMLSSQGLKGLMHCPRLKLLSLSDNRISTLEPILPADEEFLQKRVA